MVLWYCSPRVVDIVTYRPVCSSRLLSFLTTTESYPFSLLHPSVCLPPVHAMSEIAPEPIRHTFSICHRRRR